MGLTNDEILRYWKYISIGIEVGKKQLADHIVHQFEIGKPVAINNELYWLRDAEQNLQDIMDDIESGWNEEHGLYKFIVPIKKHSINNEEIVREVIIQTETAERARIIAIGDFQHDGWFVDMDYQNYKQLKG